jgi:hypothetical protein
MIVTQITDIHKWKQNYMLKIFRGITTDPPAGGSVVIPGGRTLQF